MVMMLVENSHRARKADPMFRGMNRKAGMLLAFLFLIGFCCSAQEIQKLRHKYYKSYFNTATHIPVIVEYELRKDMVDCPVKIKRLARFSADPLLPVYTSLTKDYKGSSYQALDCGHNMSAEDNACDKTGMIECFYYSNMFPQDLHLNRGVWKTLEKREREWAKDDNLKIYVGSYGRAGVIGADRVVVPQFCYKIIFFSNGTHDCYLFPNAQPVNPSPEFYKVDISVIENKTGIRFSRRSANIPGVQAN